MPEALLEVVDAGLESGDAVLQLGEIALEHLAPARLIGEAGFNSAQRLKDRLVLLLEPLEAPVDFIEMLEHLLTKVGEHLCETSIHRVESAVDLRELASQELDELPVLGRGHGFSLAQVRRRFKSVQRKTANGDRPSRRVDLIDLAR